MIKLFDPYSLATQGQLSKTSSGFGTADGYLFYTVEVEEIPEPSKGSGGGGGGAKRKGRRIKTVRYYRIKVKATINGRIFTQEKEIRTDPDETVTAEDVDVTFQDQEIHIKMLDTVEII